MRKLLATLVLMACAGFAAAESYDSKVRNAVNELASGLTSPLEVSIGNILLGGTQSSSGLSRNLSNRINHHAVNTDRLRVIPRTRDIRRRAGGSSTGIIEGTFVQSGNNVTIVLQLIMEQGDIREIRRSSMFTVSLADLEREGIVEILPANFNTQEEAREREAIFTPLRIETPTVPVNTPSFHIAAWPNSDTNTFIDGDELRITIEANQGCYFKVYHIDHYNNEQLLFPYRANQNNQLRAYVPRTIPDSDGNLTIQAPFGQDTIIVVASIQQFPGIEAEIRLADEARRTGRTQQASRESVDRITRGVGVRVATDAQPVEIASTRFNFTSLPDTYADEFYSYRRPANMVESVRSMQTEVRQLGGTFNGNEREGTYTIPGIQGRYWVSGDTVNVNQRSTGNQLTQRTRSARGTFNFTIDRPRNMTQAVQAVRNGIESKGGTFSGNERQGSFSVSGIAGRYNVEDQVSVNIIEKPFLIPNSMIEREVRSYFSGY